MQNSIIVIGLILIIFLFWTLIEQKQLKTSIYKISSDNLPEVFHNTSFVVLSDLHNYVFGRNNERLIKKIERLSPEFIIVAGDMINKRDLCYPSNAYTLLEQLAKKYKIYYAFGNHEQGIERQLSAPVFPDKKKVGPSWLEYKKNLASMNVAFLDNKSILYEKDKESLRITGVTIHPRFFERGKLKEMEEGYLNSLIKIKPEGVYEILIAHTPLYFKEYANWGADLTISGHLHGGLVRLPFLGGVVSPQVQLFPKFYSGVFEDNGKQMVVSRGLGSHSLMPRVFNAPEIVSVTLKKNKKENGMSFNR